MHRPRNRFLRAAPLLVLCVAVLGATAPAQAAPRSEPRRSAPEAATLALAPPSPDLPGLPPMSLDLARVPVDSRDFRTARDAYVAVADSLSARQSSRVGIDAGLTSARIASRRLTAQLAAGRARAASLRTRLDQLESAIADLSVNLFVSGGSAARIDAALTDQQPSINDQDRKEVLASSSLDVLLAERAAYRARLRSVTELLDATTADLRAVADQQRDLVAARPAALAAEAAAAGPVAEQRVSYEHARVLATIEGADFPLVALDTYHRAARAMREDRPGCDVQWWGIAGISRVEGRHGSYGGSSLDERGNTTKKIIGIPLNGANSTRVIGDTDDGTLDGDPVYDRAVGPMQFIPSTWRRYAADGNGDGVEDPHNLYDAAQAAARYLCRASYGLDADAGLRRAYFSYNHSPAYVERVLSFARAYERAIEVPTGSIDPD